MLSLARYWEVLQIESRRFVIATSYQPKEFNSNSIIKTEASSL
jgi:hypothetical protein